MPYPFCNSTKELEDTEAPDAFSLYLLENEKMLNFLFEIIMHLFQRITNSKGEKKNLVKQRSILRCQNRTSSLSITIVTAMWAPVSSWCLSLFQPEQYISALSYAFPVQALKSRVSPSSSCFL